jgi:hypothetical protein
LAYLIIAFSAVTIIAGLIILINPDMIFRLLRRHLESLSMHILAVVLRVILGLALIVCAAASKFPTAILVLGWVSIVAAAVLAIVGRRNFKRLMSWALGLAPHFGRIGGLLAILFGAFLVYAVT